MKPTTIPVITIARQMHTWMASDRTATLWCVATKTVAATGIATVKIINSTTTIAIMAKLFIAFSFSSQV